MAELADAPDLGAVTLVKNFRLGFDLQLLVQGFPLNKVIYVQIKIRDFIALYALKSQTDKVSPRISHFQNSSFLFLIKAGMACFYRCGSSATLRLGYPLPE